MSTLVLALPPGEPDGYRYATSVDGVRVQRNGDATPDLLPAAARGVEVVAIVPARQLSWYRVHLPKGVGARSQRLRQVLVGLLEERLLDDPEALHFALAPGSARDGSTEVAVCPREWLLEHVQALDNAGVPVARIVPEFRPRGGSTQLCASGQPGSARLLATGTAVPGGALILPLAPESLALLGLQPGSDELAAAEIVADPAVTALAEQILRVPVTPVATEQRMLHASRSPWNLAQGELTRKGYRWTLHRAGSAWREFLHTPRWRPARIGIVVLVLAQLAGINLLAWRASSAATAQRAQIAATLTGTFPHVQVVVDAPLQMAREVASLRRRTGALLPGDLEPMLDVAAHLSEAATPERIEFVPGQLRLHGMRLPAHALEQAQLTLQPLGYELSAEADALLLQASGTP